MREIQRTSRDVSILFEQHANDSAALLLLKFRDGFCAVDRLSREHDFVAGLQRIEHQPVLNLEFFGTAGDARSHGPAAVS